MRRANLRPLSDISLLRCFSIPRRATCRVVLILSLLAGIISGCDFGPGPVNDNRPNPSLTPASPIATRPAERRGGTLTIRLAADATSLNPWPPGRDPTAQAVTGLVF